MRRGKPEITVAPRCSRACTARHTCRICESVFLVQSNCYYRHLWLSSSYSMRRMLWFPRAVGLIRYGWLDPVCEIYHIDTGKLLYRSRWLARSQGVPDALRPRRAIDMIMIIIMIMINDKSGTMILRPRRAWPSGSQGIAGCSSGAKRSPSRSPFGT